MSALFRGLLSSSPTLSLSLASLACPLVRERAQAEAAPGDGGGGDDEGGGESLLQSGGLRHRRRTTSKGNLYPFAPAEGDSWLKVYATKKGERSAPFLYTGGEIPTSIDALLSSESRRFVLCGGEFPYISAFPVHKTGLPF